MIKNRKKNMFSYLLSVFFGFCFVNCTNNDISKMEDTWREFRALHPYSYQTVALKHYGDTCVFVMSEPDSWVKKSDLEQLFDKYDGQIILRYQPYGYDGQLTDAIGCAILDSISFPDFEKDLFTLLYKTDYKPYYTDLDHPIKHVYYSKDYNLNYTISPFIIESDLNEVFIAPSLDGTCREKTVTELLESDMCSSNEIYFSKDRGFIIWVLKTDTLIQTDLFLQNARRFSLDTDLILGLIPRRDSINKLAIVAREREVPINILPPLRSETILLLASHTNEKIELSFDSYNKSLNDSTLATYISMSYWLENTELGNLMIMTDVLLKSWSENCKVRDYFLDYPIPDSYPFPKGVSNELGYIPHYLWDFYFDGETGCMPLEFNPPQETMVTGKEREIAFKTRMHFANLNCVDLVRATQYAAIYQLFNGLNVNYSIQNDSWICTPTWTVSNKIWGIGGYASQKGLTKAIKTAIKGPKIPHVPIRPIGPRPINPHIIEGAKIKYSDLSYVLEKNPEVSPLLLQYPNLAIVLRERPHLANLIPVYPFLPEALAKYPKIIDELEKYPSLSNSLAEYPKLANILEKNPELSKILSDNPELVEVLVNVPLTADLLLKNPELANTLTNYPEVAEVIVGHRELSKVLSKHPVLADALTSTPQLADALVKYPSLAEEMASFPNIADISTRNPLFLELLSRRERDNLRECLNITPSTNVQRGLDNRFHNVPVSNEDVLSNIQIQKVCDVSTQRINKMIDMRLQIKQELIKKGIKSKEVLWEINNTLRAYIILDQYDEEFIQAA